MAEVVSDKKIELRVIAPTMATDKSPYKFQKSVDMVIMRCTTGDMGILPGRMPVSAVLDSGVLRIFDEEASNQESQMVVLGGVAHVSDDILTILSDAAYKPDEIDTAEVTAKMKEYQRLCDAASDFNEKTAYRKDIHRCQIQLDVAGTAGK
ncbi:MAG: ATP synthase F1 subunit epsilon [Defluviitaleaceae bacterium]|nr:ATP synthase F1 subunit epsilon [Defluviitaleaceae bacterium]MCL2262036.1 ATP synthase F1 subunit epsilon [Defluviitaleaceae bacterium]